MKNSTNLKNSIYSLAVISVFLISTNLKSREDIIKESVWKTTKIFKNGVGLKLDSIGFINSFIQFSDSNICNISVNGHAFNGKWKLSNDSTFVIKTSRRLDSTLYYINRLEDSVFQFYYFEKGNTRMEMKMTH